MTITIIIIVEHRKHPDILFVRLQTEANVGVVEGDRTVLGGRRLKGIDQR